VVQWLIMPVWFFKEKLRIEGPFSIHKARITVKPLRTPPGSRCLVNRHPKSFHIGRKFLIGHSYKYLHRKHCSVQEELFSLIQIPKSMPPSSAQHKIRNIFAGLGAFQLVLGCQTVTRTFN
jgi:hypothetical protein